MPAAESTPSYFRRIDDKRLVPTTHAQGAWHDDEQHFSPLGGLIVHAIERARADRGQPELAISRICFDILGRIALDEFEIQVDTIRPGRTIELTEATVLIGGRPVVRARAWLLSAQDTAVVAGGQPARLPSPGSLQPWPMTSVWSGGFIASLETRVVGTPEPGRATAWVTSQLPLVAEESASPLASYVGYVDTANGIAVRQEPTQWMFPNVDLSIHLYRQPTGPWTGLDTSVTFGPNGQGVTSTVLHDQDGPVGHAQQSLTVRQLAR